MEYVITKQSPPESLSGSIYPFSKMEAGDYTVIDPVAIDRTLEIIRIAMSAHSRRHNQKFTSKVDKETGLLHVWRMS